MGVASCQAAETRFDTVAFLMSRTVDMLDPPHPMVYHQWMVSQMNPNEVSRNGYPQIIPNELERFSN